MMRPLTRVCQLLTRRPLAVIASHPSSTASLSPSSVTSLSSAQLAEIRALAARTNETFKNEQLLIQALTHRTFDGYAHNGRLSLLGESIISQSVTEHLYFNFPNLYSSALKAIRDRFLSADVLGPIGRKLGFQDALLYTHASTESEAPRPAPYPNSKRAKYHVTPTPPQKIPATAVAAAFKAFVGALYADRGYLTARAYVQDFVVHVLKNEDLSDFVKLEHPKAVLNNLHAASGNEPLSYRMIEETGRATHLPTFMVGIFAGDKCLGRGAGFNLKLAENEAARAVLRTHYLKELSLAKLPFDLADYSPEDETESITNESVASVSA
eukprot:m.21308 g.21308  ORF g.21308 m.21308 type:complete len:325 (-) comp9074_c0_seq1:112-1086(-)